MMPFTVEEMAAFPECKLIELNSAEESCGSFSQSGKE
jgi:hypothetical protein